jgi:hypothetical protein
MLQAFVAPGDGVEDGWFEISCVGSLALPVMTFAGVDERRQAFDVVGTDDSEAAQQVIGSGRYEVPYGRAAWAASGPTGYAGSAALRCLR